MKSVVLLAAVAMAAAESSAELNVITEQLAARFSRGELIYLADGEGAVFAQQEEVPRGSGIHLLSGDHWAEVTGIESQWDRAKGAVERYAGFNGLEGGSIVCRYGLDQASGDLVVEQRAESSQEGLWGVEWAVSGIPLDMNIIVPGQSGLKLTASSPERSVEFDYPMTWEAQLVIVEGEGRGFYVWAEDAKGLFKRLRVERRPDGWRLGFITMPFAPFEDKTFCDSAKWRLNVYRGDWRVPAKVYRTWAETNLGPTAVEQQHPAWVKDIRCMVIMGLDKNLLGKLARHIDPAQTLLYIPQWRKPGYDRDYPVYNEYDEGVRAFMDHAHALGYRVMLHVNYFGVDPKHPLYAQFEPYQVRSPWGSHEKEWWLWERAEPPIKFAYINPAHKPWRDEFVSRMTALCEDLPVDALHLDQTLCIYNDYNGLMGGMSMLEGNAALHRALREALPDVALSGEGLNEATYRHEAFAQRHVPGIDHTQNVFNRPDLDAAHAVSSYLLRPYTVIYGYLGYPPPSQEQLYAAYNEAYRHWGVIPTLKLYQLDLDAPEGFVRQWLDEASFWCEKRVDIAVDGPWPANVAFPFTAADGVPVVRTNDRRLLYGDDEISRTITGLRTAALPGTVPGWPIYNERNIAGLDPGKWYPYFQQPRELGALHVENVPVGYTVEYSAVQDGLAFMRFGRAVDPDYLLARLMGKALCGSRYLDGAGFEVQGQLDGEDGAQFKPSGDHLFAHPPWKAARGGLAYARFSLELPQEVWRFVSSVAMDSMAVGADKSDGVTFGVTVRKGEQEKQAEVHQATALPAELTLDLTDWAGERVELELTVDPGPAKHVSYDWARWYNPQIERRQDRYAALNVAGAGRWNLLLTDQRSYAVRADRQTATSRLPGALYLLHDEPAEITVPCDLSSLPYVATFVAGAVQISDPLHACALIEESTVAGETRTGIYAHPPDGGRTIVDFPMTLPVAPALFEAYAGIRDGSTSTGVLFIVEVNGVEIVRKKASPGAWHEIQCDLQPWQGKPIVLSLITDSDGPYECDWAHWGKPTLRIQ